jgi:hypothetical protein
MQNVKVIKSAANMTEGWATELFFDGLRKADRHGNRMAIVGANHQFIFVRAVDALADGSYACELRDDSGRVVAVCHMDANDL